LPPGNPRARQFYPPLIRSLVDFSQVLKLLLIPLRLSVGWGLSPRLLGFIGAVSLVLLRVTIGWHFYTEGMDKYKAGDWSAAPFFANANGPFAQDYRKIVWDWDGRFRLNRDAMMQVLATFREQASVHFGFDESQKARAQANYVKAIEQYEWVLSENAADLEEFALGRDRIERLNTAGQEKDIRDGVSSLGGQRDAIRREWQGKGAPSLKQINTLWENYESDQNKIATLDQRNASGYFSFVKPRTNLMDTSTIDRFVPYFDMGIGLCLLFGFLTPVAALAAAGFLGSVFLSQLPPTSGPSSTYYQLVESMACLVLAGTGAGRLAGIDYFLHLIVRKVWGGEIDRDF
jgi:uncharacterized membrane protein YphA (DoxX/SURF4 family)